MARVQHNCTGCVPIDASIIEVYTQLISTESRAEEAAERAEHAAEHAIGKSPYIGENGDWWEWNDEQAAFIDTGVQAQGQVAVDIEMSTTSTNPVQNRVVTAAVNEKYTKPATGIPATDIAEGVIPDVSQFITASVNNLVNYYLKSETYNKTEVDSLIAAVSQFSYEVVATLPTASASTMYKIYLVPSAHPETQNVKDEYITIRSGSEGSYTYAWEQIGSTAIDLSGYVTTQQLNTALSAYTTTANLTTLLAAKQDVIADLATIRSGAASGATAYQKPSGGIPKSDLSSGVQGSLDLADSAIQARPQGEITPVITPADYATREELGELEAKVDDLSTGKYYGYYATESDLPDDATVDGFAYVGSGPTYTIYNCEGGVWTSSGITVNQSPVGNEEDIDQNAQGKLQFANRVYNAQQPNGMGYVILRKDKTFASQVTATNTIYEVRYDFNLSTNFTMPAGCVLKFNGGEINGVGTLTLSETALEGRPRILCNVGGNIKGASNALWFGLDENKRDNTNSDAISKAALLSDVVIIPSGRYIISTTVSFPSTLRSLNCDGYIVYTGKVVGSSAFVFTGLTGANIDIFRVSANYISSDIPSGNVDYRGDGSTTDVTGIKIINCFACRFKCQISYFNTGISLHSDGNVSSAYPGTALNTINATITVFNYGIKCSTDNGGFVNQNYFSDCMVSNSAALPDDGHTSVGIVLVGDGHTIENTDLEGSNYHIGIIATDVRYCLFGPLRAERIATAIKFIGNCYANSLINGYDLVYDGQKIDSSQNVGNAFINWGEPGHERIDGRNIKHKQYMYKYITYNFGSVSRSTITADRFPYGMLFKVTGPAPSVKVKVHRGNPADTIGYYTGITALKSGSTVNIKDVVPTMLNCPGAYKVDDNVQNAVFWYSGQKDFDFVSVGVPEYVDTFFVAFTFSTEQSGDYADLFFTDCVPVFDYAYRAANLNNVSGFGRGNNGDIILDNSNNRVFYYNGSYLRWMTPEGFTRGNLFGPVGGRPTNLNANLDRGYRYFNTDTNKFLIWNGSKYVEFDGASMDAKRFGTTADRPIASEIFDGFVYFDTSISKPIWWNGSAWVDATGTAV